ncbi:MAG: decaprenylphospho-beta-D-ribofuranose 2-oxidase [Myxococcota bacterium]|jgi:decaprenylphospho-beta-D-ribofuranose 2-oxidase
MAPRPTPAQTTPKQPLNGWGRFPVTDARYRRSEDLERLTRGAQISRGLGRAYGDAALPPPGSGRLVAGTTRADRILGFDPASGVLRAEAGFTLSDLGRLFLPRGWFTPVSPGTQYVTLGGMVASDIHGKNHHAHGCISEHVRQLRLRVGTGEVLDITPESHPELFWATCGGQGLTGHILEVGLQLEKLPSPWLYEETQRYGSMQEVFDALQEESARWPMTVAWIDTSVQGAARGRGIVMAGRWATPDEAPRKPPTFNPSITVPPVFPSGVMNPVSVRALNALWYAKHPRKRVKHVVKPASFFWILDLAQEWNRGYGKRGFIQYQCVMPSSMELYNEFLDRFTALGGCSFITVFKDCGPAGRGHLSFPQKGTSLALDIPLGPGTRRLVRELNAFVIANGGRIYLSKDALTNEDEFRRMYPRFEEWQEIRLRYDPERRIQSGLSHRLMGD